MSVKSIGYKSSKVVSGTYTTPKLTVNRAGQITEIQSQVIDPDDTEQAAYETLAGTMEDVDTALAEVAETYTNLTKYQGLDVNYSLYVQLKEKYDELNSQFETLIPGNTTNLIGWSLDQNNFQDRLVGNSSQYRALNAENSIFLDTGFYNIDFNFLAVVATPSTKQTDFFFRVSDTTGTIKGPCQAFCYGSWNNGDNTYVAFNGSMVFNMNSQAHVDLLVPNTLNGVTIIYSGITSWNISSFTSFPSSGDYSGLPAITVPAAPNAIVITALDFSF